MKVSTILNPPKKLKLEITKQELTTFIEFGRIVGNLCKKIDVEGVLSCNVCPMRPFCINPIEDKHKFVENMVYAFNLQSERTMRVVDKIEFEGESEE